MSVAQAAPSSFATLLRRSKFATYDPAIGQVYTAYGGQAFRGDWGFKRPLPSRRRPGFITVQSVDTREQQTNWRSAEGSARWIRRWDELGKKLEISDQGSWSARIGALGAVAWNIDSEFDFAGEKGRRELHHREVPEDSQHTEATKLKAPRIRSTSSIFDNVPNPDAMTPKQFRNYIKHLRTLRPQFKEYLKKFWRDRHRENPSRQLQSENMGRPWFTASGDIHMLPSAQTSFNYPVTRFLADRAEDELESITSSRIGQQPHTLAGLEYTRMSLLQSKYLHKPVPGRFIGITRTTQYEFSDSKHLVAVAGLVGSLPPKSHGLLTTDFGTQDSPRKDKERGKGEFRLNTVVLQRAPRTVGRAPERATRTEFGAVEFRLNRTQNLSNAHPLGSPEYVNQSNPVGQHRTHGDGHPTPSSLKYIRKKVPDKPKVVDSRELIKSLGNMMSKNPRSGR